MTDYEDSADVVLRSTDSGNFDRTFAKHLQIKSLLEKRKDEIINALQDPAITEEERQQLQMRKTEVKADIASLRVGGSEVDFWKMWQKYRSH